MCIILYVYLKHVSESVFFKVNLSSLSKIWFELKAKLKAKICEILVNEILVNSMISNTNIKNCTFQIENINS